MARLVARIDFQALDSLYGKIFPRFLWMNGPCLGIGLSLAHAPTHMSPMNDH